MGKRKPSGKLVTGPLMRLAGWARISSYSHRYVCHEGEKHRRYGIEKGGVQQGDRETAWGPLHSPTNTVTYRSALRRFIDEREEQDARKKTAEGIHRADITPW
jgi:hypothetical protein